MVKTGRVCWKRVENDVFVAGDPQNTKRATGIMKPMALFVVKKMTKIFILSFKIDQFAK